jgi:hypothetical protein
MSGRARMALAAVVVVVLAACAGAFAAGRSSVDRTPPSLPAARVVTVRPAPVTPAIVLPPRAVLP